MSRSETDTVNETSCSVVMTSCWTTSWSYSLWDQYIESGTVFNEFLCKRMRMVLGPIVRTSGFIKSTRRDRWGGVERSKPSGHRGWVDGVLHRLSQAELIRSWPFHGFWLWLQYWVPLLCIPIPGWRMISDDQLQMSFQELPSLGAHVRCFLENTISSLWW